MIASLLLTLAGNVQVELPMEAHVRGTELALGAFASVRCDDPALARRVQELRLGYAPAPGYSRLIQSQWLRGELASLAPDLHITLVGERACRIHPEVARVPSAAIEAAARAELEKRLTGLDASCELADAVRELEVPAGAAPSTLSSTLDAREVRPGIVAVPVAVAVDGEAYRTVWTSWRVQQFDVRPVLVRSARAGEALASDAIELRRTAVEPGAPAARLEPRMLSGAVLARDMQAGAVLTPADLVRPHVVQKGDTLQLAIVKGAVQVKSSALACQSGAVGDRIKVSVGESGRELTAVITARATAEVDLSLGS